MKISVKGHEIKAKFNIYEWFTTIYEYSIVLEPVPYIHRSLLIKVHVMLNAACILEPIYTAVLKKK